MLANTLLKISYVDEQCPINLICYFSPFISCLSHLSSYLSLFICYLSHFIGYLTTSYLVYHCSYLDEHPFFNFISWRTCPKKLHILFINLQLFTNIPLKTSYVDEQWLKILICYFSCFSSYLSPNFISWWTSAIKIHSLFYRIQLLFITLHSLFINLISWRTHMLFSAFQFLTMSTIQSSILLVALRA